MPAFPGTWVFTTFASGVVPASVIVPAPAPNIRRVITEVAAKTYDVSGGGPFGPTVTIFNPGVLAVSTLITDSPGGPIVDTDIMSGPFIGLPGTIMTISFNASKVGIVQTIRVSGYDL